MSLPIQYSYDYLITENKSVHSSRLKSLYSTTILVNSLIDNIPANTGQEDIFH